MITYRRDGPASDYCLRSLGTGPTQSAAGNHTHAIADIVSAFDPGTLSIPSGRFILFADHLTLTGSNSASLAGTSILRII